jgi:hypothetical protein
VLKSRRHRLCRELDRRPLEQPRPGGPADAVHRQPRRGGVAIYGSWWGSLAHRVKHLVQPQFAPRQPQEHPRPLRPGQRLLPRVAGRDHELLQRAVRGRPGAAHAAGPARQGAAVRCASAVRPAAACWRSAAAGVRWPKTAATEFGAHVTGVTLSTEQLAYAQERMRHAGVDAAAVDLRLQDYRDIADGPFDAIVHRDVRSRGPRILGQLLRHAAQPAQARRPRLHPDHHHPRRPVRTLRAQSPTSSSSTSSRAACCPAPAPSAPKRSGRPASESTNWPLAPTTPRPCAAGARTSWRVTARCGAWASTPASCASGSSTWRTAKRPLPPATPTSCSSRCSGRPDGPCAARRLLALGGGLLWAAAGPCQCAGRTTGPGGSAALAGRAHAGLRGACASWA